MSGQEPPCGRTEIKVFIIIIIIVVIIINVNCKQI